MKKLKAHYEIASITLSCAWCLAQMDTLTLAEVKHTGRAHIMCGECKGINVLPNDILTKAQHKTAKIDPDNPPGRAAAFDNIVGNIVLKRALETAIVGHHTLTYVGDESIAWQEVSAILGARATRMTVCPCGYFKHPTIECRCTYQEIEEWRGGSKFLAAQRNDIHVEVVTPDPEEFFAWREPFSEVLKRVRNIRDTQMFQRASYGRAHNAGYKQVIDFLADIKKRLGMTTQHFQSMGKVAMTLADMDGVEFVGINHAAEAAGYKTPLLLNY